MKIIEIIWIVAAIGWFTWAFADGFLWLAIFGAGFYLGNLCHRNNDPEEEPCPPTQ